MSYGEAALVAAILILALATCGGVGAGIAFQTLFAKTREGRFSQQQSRQQQRRRQRVQRFLATSRGVITDTCSLLGQENRYNEARSCLSLVSQAYRCGHQLLLAQRVHHRFLHPYLEARLFRAVHELLLLEQSLRNLPRCSLTLEEILGTPTKVDHGGPLHDAET